LPGDRPSARGATIGTLFAALFTALFIAVPRPASSQVTEPTREDTASPAATDASEGESQSDGEDPALPTLDPVLITAPAIDDSPPGATRIDDHDLAAQRATTSDSARLLEDIPGVSLTGAGGISSLPSIHGLADDRLRVQVDGMDPTSACPNHMNPALSYISPAKVGRVTVFSGVTPVSVGGDSIGGTIQVESLPPAFATAAGKFLATGQAGAFFRSNGEAHGYDLAATAATEKLHLSYHESNAESDDYTAATAFKAGAVGSLIPGGEWLSGNVVGSSAYEDLHNRGIELAVRHKGHLLELTGGLQQLGFEGFPNQRMDMTDNRNLQLGVRYKGQYPWGELESRMYGQNTRHEMNMGSDRFFYGFGMPMNSKATTRGGSLQSEIDLSERDVVRVGSEFQIYDLDDWWPAVGTTGAMAPNTFWNIRNGERDRIGIFGEWEARWSPEWLTLIGVRGETVASRVGVVQGYNGTIGLWSQDATTFNRRDRTRRDVHLDLTALAQYMPFETLTLEAGYARKARSPNLYERYAWSTNSMAALMNNFVGDGNGYVGNADLRPEVADTFSGTVDWHDANDDAWQLKATGYFTGVDDFIDARRCTFGQCSALNATRKTGFVLLQYANQSARLYGLDLSGHALLWKFDRFGSFTATGLLNFVRGVNRNTDEHLHHIMPLNGKLGLAHRLGALTTIAEVQLVAARTLVSKVRNEVPTEAYALVNLRSSYEWKHARIDLSIENVFDRFYQHPLGGAYLGQGASMSTATIPWGVKVPGMGRSFDVALTLKF
jgi:iron complex outermembrane receptor protein